MDEEKYTSPGVPQDDNRLVDGRGRRRKSSWRLIAPGRAWAVDLTVRSPVRRRPRSWALTRTIAPHDKLDDAAYAFVVRAVDTGCDQRRKPSGR